MYSSLVVGPGRDRWMGGGGGDANLHRDTRPDVRISTWDLGRIPEGAGAKIKKSVDGDLGTLVYVDHVRRRGREMESTRQKQQRKCISYYIR